MHDFHALLYRLFGVHALFRLERLPSGNVPWDWNRFWLCDWIRRKPGMAARCDESEAALCRAAGRGCALCACHAGLTQFAVPVRSGGRTLGHVICAPIRTGSSLAAEVRRVVGLTGNALVDDEWALRGIEQLPHFDAHRRRAVAALIRMFFAQLAAAKPADLGGRFEWYHLSVRTGEPETWISRAWAGFEPETREPKTNGWCLHRSHHALCFSRAPLTLEMPGRTLRLGRNRLVVMPPGQRYRAAEVEPPDPFWIHAGTGLRFDRLALRPLVLRQPSLACLHALMAGAAADSEFGHGAPAKLRILEFLLSLGGAEEDARRTPGRPPTPPTADLVQRARDYLHTHVADRVTLGQLAGACCSNLYTLCRRFHETYGRPPLAYHRSLKIAESVRLLQETNLSIKQISYRLGFSSPFHFSSAFKQERGVSPRGFRSTSHMK